MHAGACVRLFLEITIFLNLQAICGDPTTPYQNAIARLKDRQKDQSGFILKCSYSRTGE
jgi:hypothetical protein